MVWLLADDFEELEQVLHKWLKNLLRVCVFDRLGNRLIRLQQTHLQLFEVFECIGVILEIGSLATQDCGTS